MNNWEPLLQAFQFGITCWGLFRAHSFWSAKGLVFYKIIFIHGILCHFFRFFILFSLRIGIYT